MVLDDFVRDHFSTDLGEAAEPAFNDEKSVFIETSDVASAEPVVLQNFCGFAGLFEVAFEDVGPFKPNHAGLVDG